MGNYLTEPKKDKETVMGTGPGLVWGSTGMQGWRTSMEDAHITLPDLGGPLAGIGMYAVFDGHGGKEVAEFCEQHMPAEFLHLAMQSRDILTALKGAFHRMDDMLRMPEYFDEIRSYRNSQDVGPASSGGNQPSEDLQNSIKDDMADARAKGCITKEDAETILMKMMLLRRMGAEEATEPAFSVGFAAVCVLVTPNDIICANAGDSRAVLCRKGRAVALSVDHKPNLDTERYRIEAAGGTVAAMRRGQITTYRVNGNLSLSRAIGDLQYKTRGHLPPEKQIVCATPEIVCHPRHPEDEFVIVACDGIWDVKSSQEACNFVRRRLLRKVPLKHIMEQLLEACCTSDPRKSMGLGADNMTLIIVKFDQWQTDAVSGSSCACTVS